MQRQNNYVGAAIAIAKTMFSTSTNLLNLEAGNLKKLEKPEATKRKLASLMSTKKKQRKLPACEEMS